MTPSRASEGAFQGRHWRYWLLAGVVVASTLGLWFYGPIAQPADYHAFADRRNFFGISNFWNVVSNLPFLLVGLAGLRAALASRPPGMFAGLRPAYATCFAGSVLVGLGSAYYHLAPDNGTLVWDRLAMAITLMAFFAVILGEHMAPRIGRRALWPLVAVGMTSVLYWRYSELDGHGDLRLYILMQFLPMLAIPLVMGLFPSRLSRVWLMWAVVLAYAVAKGFEMADAPVYQVLGISGHSLKHIAAAGAMLILLASLWNRSALQAPVPPGPQEVA